MKSPRSSTKRKEKKATTMSYINGSQTMDKNERWKDEINNDKCVWKLSRMVQKLCVVLTFANIWTEYAMGLVCACVYVLSENAMWFCQWFVYIIYIPCKQKLLELTNQPMNFGCVNIIHFLWRLALILYVKWRYVSHTENTTINLSHHKYSLYLQEKEK